MSAEIIDSGSGTVTLKVDGKLTEEHLLDAQRQLAEILRARGRSRILLLGAGFQGWEKGGKWNDFSFQEKADRSIEKMAIVGDPKMKDDVLMFVGKGWRPFPIKYFAPEEAALAREWLQTTGELPGAAEANT